eukprot:ANDGO_07950.mRNA.1 UPF0678 fatty acid-binding protein-like protein MSMEG_6574/MSMEI_6396
MNAVFDLVSGKYAGIGKGVYPTIKSFSYVEACSFERLEGKPVFLYTQKTRNAETGEGLHAEAGFLKLLSPNQVELVLAHPFGVAEIMHGTWSLSRDDSGNSLLVEVDSVIPGTQETDPLKQNAMVRSASVTKPFAFRERRSFVFTVSGVSYTMGMATESVPEVTRHLEATLSRSAS